MTITPINYIIKNKLMELKKTMNPNCKIEIVTGTSKKDKNRQWRAVRIVVGEWSTLYFPKSTFETDYIERTLKGE